MCQTSQDLDGWGGGGGGGGGEVSDVKTDQRSHSILEQPVSQTFWGEEGISLDPVCFTCPPLYALLFTTP